MPEALDHRSWLPSYERRTLTASAATRKFALPVSWREIISAGIRGLCRRATSHLLCRCAMARGPRLRAEELALPVDELLPVDRDRLTSDQNGAVAVEMETRCFETGALQPASWSCRSAGRAPAFVSVTAPPPANELGLLPNGRIPSQLLHTARDRGGTHAGRIHDQPDRASRAVRRRRSRDQPGNLTSSEDDR
jgi:hypothetical protein